jgi:hypothetical protein
LLLLLVVVVVVVVLLLVMALMAFLVIGGSVGVDVCVGVGVSVWYLVFGAWCVCWR